MNTTAKHLHPKWLIILICLALGVATAIVYWPVRSHEFIVLDDQDYLVRNPQVQSGITGSTVRWAFTQSYAGNWHPLTWISHMLDVQLFGLNPGSHHLVNAAFHLANSILFFLLLKKMTRSLWQSAFVAALFALHPLHVESVAWAAERKDVLSTFFFILTVAAYSHNTEFQISNSKRKRAWFILSVVLFALGLMSKSMLVTLPFILLLLDFWPLNRIPLSTHKFPTGRLMSLALEKIPFFLLSAIVCGVTVWSQSASQAIGTVDKFPIGDRIANSLTAYLGYIEKMFWPAKLSVFYPFPTEPRTEKAAVALVLLVGFTVFAFLNSKRRPYLFTGWLWYLGTLVPVIGLVQVGSHALADRYTYLPLIGLFIIISWGTAEVSAKWKYQKLILGFSAAALILTLSSLTARQVTYWKNDKTLFTHASQVDDQNYLAWAVLGDTFRLEGNLAQAVDYSRRAIQLRPNSEIPWYCLALSLMALQQPHEADQAFQTALKNSPENAHILNDYGKFLINVGHLDEAAIQLAHARLSNPYLIGPRLNQVVLFQSAGKLNEALKQCEDILEIDPGNNLVRALMASIYSALGQPAQAIPIYREVVRQNPTNNNARIGLGLALMETRDFTAAESEFSTVIRTDPRNALALDSLGFVLAQGGQLNEADAKFLASLEIQPDAPNTHLHYAMSLTAQKKAIEAVREYHKVLDLDGTRLVALNNLAWMLASFPDPAIRNGVEAVKLAEEACRLTNNQQPFYLGTLAAAYAEAGRFTDAIATAKKACDLAKNLGLNEVAARNDQLLELYRSGKAFHESAENR